MPLENQEVPLKSASWCRGVCRGTQAHKILASFSRNLSINPAKSELESRTVKSMEGKLPELSDALDRAACDRLYALAIEILRRSAFIDIADSGGFVWNCHHLIQTVWKKGYQSNLEKKTNPGGLADPVFDPDDFIGGWIRDLPKVRPKSLPSYVQILFCEGLGDCASFNKAIEDLQTRLLQPVSEADSTTMDKCGSALIRYVLDPMVSTYRSKVIDCLALVTSIASEYVIKGYCDSMESLDTLIHHLGQPEKTGKGKVRKADIPLADAYSVVLPIISDTYQKVRQKRLADICLLLANLIPTVGGWRRDRRRKAPDDFTINLETFIDGDPKQKKVFTGRIRDLDVVKPCYHVCFDDLAECFPVKGTEKEIPWLIEHNSVLLCVGDGKGNTWRFREALATICIPEKCVGGVGSTANSRVLPIRGWQYKYRNKDRAGVVLCVENPPPMDIPALPVVFGDQGEAEETSQPQEIPGISESGCPFANGPEGLLKGVYEWFQELSDKVRLDRRWRGYWSRGQPIDEAAIDAQIRQPLKEYVESRDGHLGAQEESSFGPCDYVVSRNTDKLCVELKPSSGKAKQAIDAELLAYMLGQGTNHGLLVIFSFKERFQAGSKELKDLLKQRNAVCQEHNGRIDVVVISFDKPESASRRKKPPQAEDHFQYYKGPLLATKGGK